MPSHRSQLVKCKDGKFGELASLASEAKGFAISTNQGAPSFFHPCSFRSYRQKKKKRKQIHTKSSYIKLGKIREYNGIKQLSVIHMDDISVAFTSVFLAG